LLLWAKTFDFTDAQLLK